MRAANILTGATVLLWFGLLLIGRSLMSGVVTQEATGYPNMGQIDYYVVWPAVIVMALLACAWICNSLRRWPALLAIVSGVCLVLCGPYFLAYGGGV
jgi:hypothetical protein